MYREQLLSLALLALLICSALIVFAENSYSVEYNVSIINNIMGSSVLNVNMTAKITYGLKLSITLSEHGALSICYRVLGINTTKLNVTGTKCIAMSLEDFLNRMLNGWVFPSPGSSLKVVGTSIVTGKTVFLGYTSYKGYPVYKLRVELPIKLPGMGSGNNLVNATLYCYTGFGLPLLVKARTGLVVSAATLDAELKSSDLPVNTASAYTVTGKYVFLLGGMPGAHLVLRGAKGGDKISVANTGSNIGYIIVIHKSDGRAFAREVDPGTNITAGLPEPLSQEVSLTATTSHATGSEWNPYYLVGLAVAAALGVTIYFYYRRKKT